MGNRALKGATSGAGHDAGLKRQRPFPATTAPPLFPWAVGPKARKSKTLVDF